MVLCIVALPVFAVLAIFSVKYRRLTKDALDCLFKTATLRKCESGLDDRIKAQITGSLLKFSPGAAGLVYRHYKVLSWIVLALVVWSSYGSVVGVYNYSVYGNCNGPDETEFCVFDPTGKHSKVSEVDIDLQEAPLLPAIEGNDPLIGNPAAGLTIIEFGCYSCPFTKRAEPIVQEVLDHYNGRVNVQFKTFDIPSHPHSKILSLAADCALEQGKYDEYHDLLFKNQEQFGEHLLYELALEAELDEEAFSQCLEEQRYADEFRQDSLMGLQSGVQGTPTFFINDQVIVGPKPFRTFKKIIDEELS